MKFGMMIVALMALTAPAFAANPGGTDGCGLGWEVTQKKTMIATTTRGTTNAFVPPTFGMTTGTIGCDQHSFAKNEMPAVNLVATSHDALVLEMAVGSGETLAALAQTMGCANAQSFAQSAQSNYSSLVNVSTSVELYKNIKALAVAQGCAI